MRETLKRCCARFLSDASGQDLIEYALLVGLIAMAAVAAVGTVGNAVNVVFWQGISTALANAL